MPLIRILLKGLQFHIRAKLSFIVFVSSETGTFSLAPIPANWNRIDAITVNKIPTMINPACASAAF